MEDKTRECTKLGFEIAKLVFKAAGIAAAYCLVREAHKILKAIEVYKKS